MSSHECPAPGCSRRIPSELFACRTHWYLIPEELRLDLWRAYRRNGILSEAYIGAWDACNDYLQAALS